MADPLSPELLDRMVREGTIEGDFDPNWPYMTEAEFRLMAAVPILAEKLAEAMRALDSISSFLYTGDVFPRRVARDTLASIREVKL